MNWLVNNPIANMYGPYFLILYGLFIIVLLVGTRFWIASHDTSDELQPVQIPANPNPYEIAWLRGGVNELIRVAVFDLLQRGFLERREEKSLLGLVRKNKIALTSPGPSRDGLTSLENRVLKHFRVPCEPAAIFDSTFGENVEFECADFKARLERDKLLHSPEWKSAAVGAGFTAGALILALGGYKFCVALSKGHTNVGFLVLAAIASLVGLAIVCRSRRLSRRGSQYLSDLQRAYERLKTRAALDSSKTTGPNSDLVLVCALFGVSSLASTPYSYYRDMFARSSGGGAGCGSGSGCGGGGGGCGGGGCGGGGCGGGGCGGCGS